MIVLYFSLLRIPIFPNFLFSTYFSLPTTAKNYQRLLAIPLNGNQFT